MNKKEVQARVLKNGKPLDLDKFSWDESTNTFSTSENNLIIDFGNVACCTFNTSSYCIFNTGSHCTFDTGWYCTFKTGWDCTFKTGNCCTFKTGDNCTFKTGSYCTFNTGNNCTFNILKTGYFVNENRSNIVIIRYYDNYKLYELDNLPKDKFIKVDYCYGRAVEKDILPFEHIDDGIYVIKNNKQVEDYTILNCQSVGDYFDDKDTNCYVVRKDKYNAHGSTIKEAISDLQFKILRSKDVQEHIARVKEQGYITPNDYRLLTGACRYGTNKWLEENGYTWEDKKSIDKVIELTKGQYGHERLVELLKGDKKMIFKYEIGDDYSSEEIEHEPDEYDLREELAFIIARDYFDNLADTLNKEQKIKLISGIENILRDSGYLKDELLDVYEFELKDRFEARAINDYADSCYKEGDPYASQHI